MTGILFFDDQRLNLRSNMERKIGLPELLPESVYRDPNANTAWGYPGIFRDPETGIFRLLYQGWLHDGTRVALLAESDDGIIFKPRDTTKDIDIPDRVVSNQVLPLLRFTEWPACFVDLQAPAAERIKGFVVHHTSTFCLETRLMCSPDGLRWTEKVGCGWQESGPDPGVSAFWNHLLNTYILTTRPELTDRRISLVETKDWEHYTQPELSLQADALDTPLCELYGMPVLPYEEYFVGFLWLYHVDPSVEDHSPHKYYDGHVDCQLAYSLNGRHFQRTLREPIFPNGEPDSLTHGCVYPSSFRVADDRSIYIYSSACTREHGYNEYGTGSMLVHKLRPDGFVFLESTGGKGVVGTRALLWGKGEISVNVQSQRGEARVRVTDQHGKTIDGFSFDDCLPFCGDSTDWTPRWTSGRCVSSLENQTIRVEVMVKSGRLYSIRGDFIPLVGAECERFNQEGVTPRRRHGF
ncbi:MAG: hypothetical protein WCT14_10285 [Treponemataceae bacterium]